MKPIIKHVLVTTVALFTGGTVVAALLIFFGAYNFAADVPHTAPVYALLETMRERSIQVRSAKIQTPDLTDRTRMLKGAGNYEAMCAQCHLAPGVAHTEMSKGLYPAPPNLSQQKFAPAQAFWVIKHGVKASGMPAWGKSMSDDDIWDIVAFLQELPKMGKASYQDMLANSKGHSHAEGRTATFQAGPGMQQHGDSKADEAAKQPRHHADKSNAMKTPEAVEGMSDGRAHSHSAPSNKH